MDCIVLEGVSDIQVVYNTPVSVIQTPSDSVSLQSHCDDRLRRPPPPWASSLCVGLSLVGFNLRQAREEGGGGTGEGGGGVVCLVSRLACVPAPLGLSVWRPQRSISCEKAATSNNPLLGFCVCVCVCSGTCSRFRPASCHLPHHFMVSIHPDSSSSETSEPGFYYLLILIIYHINTKTN